MTPTMFPVRPIAVKATGQSLGSEFGLPFEAWEYIQHSLNLSVREMQVAKGVFNSQEQDSIARTFSLTGDIVYRTLQRIYVKLRIGSRVELISRLLSEYLTFTSSQVQPEKAYRALTA